MSVLMYEHHTISSKLNLEEALLRLEKTIGQEGCIKEYLFGTTPYYGRIFGRYFIASRIRPGRFFSRGENISEITVNGQVFPEATGCRVEIDISPNYASKTTTILFASGFDIVLLAGFVIYLINLFKPIEGVQPFIFFGMLLTLFFYSLSWIPFKIEAITCRNDFYELFGAEVEI